MSLISSLARRRTEKPKDPLRYGYIPAPQAYTVKEAFDSPARQIIITGGNQVSKTFVICAIIAAWLARYQADWVPRKRREWGSQPLQILVVVPTLKQARGDFAAKLLSLLPPEIISKSWDQDGVLETIYGDVVTMIGWRSAGDEGTRQVAQGYSAHLVFVVEEIPPRIYGELERRTVAKSGVFVMACTMGLSSDKVHYKQLDTDYFREIAQRGPWCGHAHCRHSGENNPLFRHICIPFTWNHVKYWMTRAAYQDAVTSVPVAERGIRIGGEWGRLPEGRAWPHFHESDHQWEFTLQDVVNMVPDRSKLRVLLGVDCGMTDAEFALLEAWYQEACPRCGNSKYPGWIPCGSCKGKGCKLCRPARAGYETCRLCDGRGWRPLRWTLAEYQSSEGQNSTADNCLGIRHMMETVGLVKPVAGGLYVAATDMIDDFVIDNMMAGKDYTWVSEAEKLASSQYLGLNVRYTAADKSVSRPRAYDNGDTMLVQRRLHDGQERPRWLIHPRCVITRKALTQWCHDTPHGGHQGLSHCTATVVYDTNHMHSLPAGTRYG